MNEKLIILIILLAGVLIDYSIAFVSNRPKNKKRIIVSSFRIHHSMLGLLIILIGLFINFYSTVLISLGAGIILGHTIRAAELIIVEKAGKHKR